MENKIRHQSGNYNEEEGENRSDYKKDVTDVKIWSLIIGKIGISNLEQNFYAIKDVTNDVNSNAHLRIHTESSILSYTFGDKFTLTLGTTIEVKGNIYIREKNINYDYDTVGYTSTSIENKYSN